MGVQSLPNWAYKTFWTAVAAAGASLVAVPVFNVEAWQAAGTAVVTTVINAVTALAREKSGQG